MNSEWWDEWFHDFWMLWTFIFSHLLGYIQAELAGDYEDSRYHWTALEHMIGTLADQLAALVEHGVTTVTFIWEEWANDFIADFEAWLLGLLGIEVEPDAPALEHIANLWESIIALWARFGYAITNTDLTVVDWVNQRITSVNDSIIAIWARFGPAFLEGDWTVVSWVEDKVTAVVQWVLSMYETARLQAEAATLWIAAHGQVLVDWLTDNGQNLVDWYDDHAGFYTILHDTYGVTLIEWLFGYATYYKDLYDNYHDLLLEFLEDPRVFILSYIGDLFVVPPEEMDPSWLVKLLAFLLNPIGTLLGWLVEGQATLWAWLLAWLNENFPSLDEMIDSIEPPDRGLPDVMAWAKGLREPETDEEIAYVAYLDEKLQHVLDDLLPDNPPIYLG